MFKYLIVLTSLLLVSCTWNQNGSLGTVSSETRTISVPTLGTGAHTVEIFADFQCPACINFHSVLSPVFEGYAEKWQLQIIYRQYPLTQIHKNAYRDALAALCSAEAGKFQEYKTALYALEDQKSGATVSDADRVKIATEVGIDESMMTQCLASDAYKSQVDADIARGDSLGVSGTPTIFLDGKKLDLLVFRDIGMLTKFLDQVVAVK